MIIHLINGQPKVDALIKNGQSWSITLKHVPNLSAINDQRLKNIAL